MGALFAILGCLAPLVGSVPRAALADPCLQATSLTIKEGIRGGIVAPRRHRTVVLAYDWNRRTFRAVEERKEPWFGPSPRRYRAADLAPDRFQDLIAAVTALFLPELPLEDPPGCEDLYQRSTGLRFLRPGTVWENRAPGGCVDSASRVLVTSEERQRFAAVLAIVERTLAELPMEPASALDGWTPRAWQDAQVQGMSKVIDFLSERGLSGELDANRVELVGMERGYFGFRFPWRSAQPAMSDLGEYGFPAGGCDVRFDPESERVELGAVVPLGVGHAEDVARRRAFVEAHPELSASERALILAGWIEDDMTEAMILAAWGEPDRRIQRGRQETQLLYRRGNSNEPVTLSLSYGWLIGLRPVEHRETATENVIERLMRMR